MKKNQNTQQSRFKTQYHSGSALLVTLLLIGTIGAIILTLSRTNIIKLRIASSLNESQVAYYAAEAGIEEGLLAYRADRNIQVPYKTGDTEPSSGSNNYRKVNLENLTDNSEIKEEIGDISTDNPYYELKVYYKKDLLAAKLVKDQIRELSVKNTETIRVKWNIEFNNGTSAPLARGAVEYTTLDKTNNMIKKTNPQLGYLSEGSFTVAGVDGLLQVKFVLQREANTAYSDAQFANLRLKLEMTSLAGLIDSGKTYVESIGHFGAVKRKLVAEVDRKSGALINIFDYTLYSKENIE